MDKLCACGSGKAYRECCELVHQNIHNAVTAEQLMRARYTAFTQANGAFLIQSWHPQEAKKQDIRQLEEWALSVKWMQLKVAGSTQGQANDTEGTVDFQAFFMDAGKLDVIAENSYFTKENGHWVYVGPAE
jgi:SEC-C motif-containing protein